MKPFSLLLFIPVLSLAARAATVIQIDLGYNTDGGTNRQTTDTGWNNIYWSGSALTSVPDLVDSSGNPTGYGISATTSYFENASGNANGISGVPSNATIDTVFSFNANSSVFTLTGLDSSLTYSFKFYSAVNRGDTTNRTTLFTINGQSVEIEARNNNGVWTDTISGISPDGDGNIDITIGKGTGNTTGSYLVNIIHIEAIPEPSAVLLSALGLAPLLRRRHRA